MRATVLLLRLTDLSLLMVWMIIDTVFVFSRGGKVSKRADRLSTLVIIMANWMGIWFAAVVAFAGFGVPGRWVVPLQLAGFLVFVCGIAVRSIAIMQLGRFHKPIVAIQVGHRLVDTGLYGRIRHPSYLGALVAYLGFGLALGSWMSAIVVCGIALVGYLYRMDVEERALLEGLGEEYAAYCRRTRRLIPGLY